MPDSPKHYSIPNLEQSVPGSWRFLVKETGQWFRNYVALPDLERDLAKHYKANQLPVPADLRQQIIDQICPDLPAGWCEYIGDDPDFLRKLMESGIGGRLTWKDVVAGTKILLSWVFSGCPRPSDQEAEARAKICASCRLNVHPEGCPTCNNILFTIVAAFVKGGKTPYDKDLRACKICKCSLKAKVWVDLDVMHKNMPEGQQSLFPNWCWLARPSPQPTE